MRPTDPPRSEGAGQPTELIRWLADRELAFPAWLLVETVRPLSWLLGQGALVAAPLARGLGWGDPLAEVAAWLERPDALAALSEALAAESRHD